MNRKKVASAIKNLIESVHPHFDKVVLKSESDLGFLDQELLTNYDAVKRPPTLLYKYIKYHAPCHQLTLFQPSVENFNYLCDTLASKPVNVSVASAEVTYDMVTASPLELSALLERHYVHKRKDMYYDKFMGSVYWGNRNLDNFVPVLYNRESKIVHQPCSHFEFKLSGKPMCGAYNLNVPSDFLHLDYGKFFTKNSTFYAMPSKHVIGQAIAVNFDLTYSSTRGYEKCFDKLMQIKNPSVQELMTLIKPLKYLLNSRKYKRINASFTKSIQDAVLSKLE